MPSKGVLIENYLYFNSVLIALSQTIDKYSISGKSAMQLFTDNI